jgi:hypothetical protein
VVPEVDELERDALGALGEVVDGVGRAVADVGSMPRTDLG